MPILTFGLVICLLIIIEPNMSITVCVALLMVSMLFAGGMKINEPAIDLGIVLAIISSKLDKPIDEKTICFGEVGLSGEVRGVSMAEQRVLEAKKLGFERCILPQVCKDGFVHKIDGIELVGVRNVKEALNAI